MFGKSDGACWHFWFKQTRSDKFTDQKEDAKFQLHQNESHFVFGREAGQSADRPPTELHRWQ